MIRDLVEDMPMGYAQALHNFREREHMQPRCTARTMLEDEQHSIVAARLGAPSPFPRSDSSRSSGVLVPPGPMDKPS